MMLWPVACASLALVIGCSRSPRTTVIVVDPPAQSGATAPHVTSAKTGVLATWIEPVDATKQRHRVRFASFDGGRWTAATTIVEAGSLVANWADVPSVVQQGDGTLIAHWAEKSAPDAYAYDVMLARSGDGGRTWQPLG
ncbi:MAG TPA: sialidase family protein, partial [Kofleriaceae bacterium]